MKIQMRFFPQRMSYDTSHRGPPIGARVEGRFAPSDPGSTGDGSWCGPGLFALPPSVAQTMMYAREWTITIELETPTEIPSGEAKDASAAEAPAAEVGGGRANPLGPMPEPKYGEPHDFYLRRLAEEFWARAGDAVSALAEAP